ncbi:MAG: preprotein translocase subunit SecE [Verrucomicrobia bacterium]|nr:MAG: preprotein translocase subunit SecE [Verrucomicrobiota bacterium]
MQLSRYVAETREELRKCNWPTWQELKGATVVVMITIILLGLYIAAADFVILTVVRRILPKL